MGSGSSWSYTRTGSTCWRDMGPHRRLGGFLLGVATFLLLFHPSTTVPQKCSSEEFEDDFGHCQKCQLCPKDSQWDTDLAVPDVYGICQENNPNRVMVLNSTDIFLWCTTQSSRVTKQLKQPKPLTKRTTETPTSSPTTVNTTTVQPSVTSAVGEPKPTGSTSGNINYAILGISMSVLFIVLIVGLIVWVIQRRRWQSLSSLSTRRTGSGSVSDESEVPLKSTGSDVIVDIGRNVPAEENYHESRSENPSPAPRAICINIFKTSECYVRKGDHLTLDASEAWANYSVGWVHKATQIVRMGSTILISKIQAIQGGEYVASNGSENLSVKVHVYGAGEEREGEEHEHLEVVSRKVAVENGSAQAIEHSTATRSGEENEMANETLVVPWQPSTNSQPQSGDENACMVPSGQSHVSLRGIVNYMNSLIHFTQEQRRVSLVRLCTLNLIGLLQDGVAIQRLAILLDPTSMLRLFAATRGEMSVDEIDFVWYCTKGTGNTVRGLFQHMIEKGCGDCTAADFAKFMINARWKGCDQVIHLLYRVHLERGDHCTECEALHRRYGPTEETDDVRRRNILPGYQYHLKDAICHCGQTVLELARRTCYSELFRNETGMVFCSNELWRLVGSDLGGMSMELLEHIQEHYKGAERYLAMLDYFVELYQELKVATLLQWLVDYNKMDAAKLILKHHESQMYNLKQTECDFCRAIRNKHFPDAAQPVMS